VELNYAAAAALAAEAQAEKRSLASIDVIASTRQDSARVEADDAAAAREWTRRLIESGSATSNNDSDSDLDAHEWGGGIEVIDIKVEFYIECEVLLPELACRAPL
jgi:hypothetical protein